MCHLVSRSKRIGGELGVSEQQRDERIAHSPLVRPG
jgi:hypothetical protein